MRRILGIVEYLVNGYSMGHSRLCHIVEFSPFSGEDLSPALNKPILVYPLSSGGLLVDGLVAIIIYLSSSISSISRVIANWFFRR